MCDSTVQKVLVREVDTESTMVPESPLMELDPSTCSAKSKDMRLPGKQLIVMQKEDPTLKKCFAALVRTPPANEGQHYYLNDDA